MSSIPQTTIFMSEKSSLTYFCEAEVSGDLNCLLIMMKSAKNSTPAIMPEVMPMMYKASQAGIEVLRYLNDPISMKMEAEPIN